jgi:hypothetical protein
MALAIPGDAPGYDYDKEDGNNIAHDGEEASQRLREHSHGGPNVKAKPSLSRDFVRVTRFVRFGEREFGQIRPARLQATGPRIARLDDRLRETIQCPVERLDRFVTLLLAMTMLGR